MSRDRFDVLERFEPLFEAPQPSFERFVRRRDRKRRNQRITAGVVGVAVFVGAVWIVTTGEPSDRTQTPAAPGGSATGPTAAPWVGQVGFIGLPPEGATPSTPLHGELVFGDSGIHPFYAVYVYADGRLIWERLELDIWPEDFTKGANGYTTGWLERRLTPDGVELLRSGAVPLGGQHSVPGSQLPASAWEDPEFTAYVPSRYAVCFWGQSGSLEASRVVGLLPATAQDLLRGSGRERVYEDVLPNPIECSHATIEEARSLAEILSDAGYEQDEYLNAYELQYEFTDPNGDWVRIVFETILPHGGLVMEGG